MMIFRSPPAVFSPAVMVLALTACGARARPEPVVPMTATGSPLSHAIIPAPLRLGTRAGTFRVDSGLAVYIDAGASPEVERVARHLVEILRPFAQPEPKRATSAAMIPAGSIHLTTRDALLPGPESYALTVTDSLVHLVAGAPAGLYHGVQTIRQLLPAAVESRAAVRRRLSMPLVTVHDTPRFEWRGAMLDVSRHFLPPSDVKRFIDHMALYKLNRLHLHLADDQGWRVEIRSWPNLARHGGRTEVGGGPGGYYTQAELADIVAYAGERFIAIVPEIDMPGHTNAALASYPELNCNNIAPPLYTGIRVGFSALCVQRDTVYEFVRDVVREIGAIVPTPWFHIGGDEVERLTHDQYRAFVERVQGIVRSQGKRMIGWGEIAPAALHPETIVQHWKRDSSRVHAARGGSIILSPSSRAYLDMKYDSTTVLGLSWAGYIDLRRAYDWDPATLIEGVGEESILGVEGPLWSETLETIQDVEYMAFPRLLALAEVGWSAQVVRDSGTFAERLRAHEARLTAMGINFYRAPEIR